VAKFGEVNVKDLISVLKRVEDKPGRIEPLYLNTLLLESLFFHQFGGVTKFLQTAEQSWNKSIGGKAEAGVGGGLLDLFIKLKANIQAAVKIGEETKTIVEKGLPFLLKMKLCEASLEQEGLIVDNPPSPTVARDKFLRLEYKQPAFTQNDVAEIREELGEKVSRSVLDVWEKDQNLTPNFPQVILATAQPFPMAAIVRVQSGLNGSTYFTYPPAPSAHRTVLAEVLFENTDLGITFLKTYWVIDKFDA